MRALLTVLWGLTAATAAHAQVDDATRSARAIADAVQRYANLPGMALAIGIDDRIVFSEGFGKADLEAEVAVNRLTRFRIGSIGKSLTAAGAVLLSERGQLDLDAPVREYLGEVSGTASGVTARQLAGHLGGVRHYRDGEGISHTRYEDVLDAFDLFIDDSLIAPPGTKYQYSTYGYTLLSGVMQRASGTPFLEWMQRELFEPSGMRSTVPDLVDRVIPHRAAFYQPTRDGIVPATFTDNSYKWAGGGYLSTPEDLVRFGSALLRGDLLSERGVAALFTTQRTSSGEATGYGMGFRPREDWNGRRVVHHGGSSEGGRAFLLLYPEERLVIAMASNREAAPLFEEEAQAIAHFYLDHGPGGSGAVDDTITGNWVATGDLGRDTVRGALRLHRGGATRGVLIWADERDPIPIVLVDRHRDSLLLVGAGRHGVMNAWLVSTPRGWKGRWEYLGRTGHLRLSHRVSVLPSGCSVYGDPHAESERIRRVLGALRPEVRFTNAELPPMALPDRMARYNVPGISMAVVEGDRVAWSCAIGTKRAGTDDSVTVTTLFHVKSIAKPVTAAATMRLVSASVLALDEPLARRIRSYRIPTNEHTQAVAPTLRHVLSHSAGFTRGGVDSYAPAESLPTLIESLEGRPPATDPAVTINFTPGTRARYSGGGYGVLQALLQDVTGHAFPELMDSLVFRPLGMAHSFFPQPLPSELEPYAAAGHDADGEILRGGYETLPIMAAGGLWTTASDLAAFVLTVQRAYRGQDSTFLHYEFAREMLRDHIDGWGLGFQIDRDPAPLFSHTGSGDGFKALIVGLMDDGKGAVVVVNGDGGGELRYELLRAIAEEYDWPAYRETATYALATDVGEENPRRFEGTYVWNSGIVSEVALRDGALHERFDEGAWTHLFPLSATDFVSLMDVRYRFLPGVGGSYTLEMTDETGTYYAIPPERLAEGVEGWRVVTPGGPAALDSIHFRAMGTGIHTTADAPALYFHPDGVGRVPYEVGATFVQFGEPASDEGLGLMIAGIEESTSLRHLLFRIRADGAYAIEVREGGETSRTIRPWTPHEAVVPMSGGEGRNALRVRVGSDRLVFSVNGTVVTTVPSQELGAIEGVAGFFVGRAHDVHVDGFGVTGRAPAGPAP